jgi:hypothetical protein
MEDSNQRISDALFLLSRDNYWDSIKIVYDVLINEVYLFATRDRSFKQYEVEERGKDVLCCLHEMLVSKKVANINTILSEIRLLTIFFNNFSREALKSNGSNYKVRVLALNLIGLVKFFSQSENTYSYNFGGIESPLIRELQNNLTEEIYKATTPYFEIRYKSLSLFNKDFWQDLERFDATAPLSVFNEEEFLLLLEYRAIIDEHQLNIRKNERDVIEDTWQSHLNINTIIRKVILQYHVLLLLENLNEFRKSDLQSSKYNVYKAEREKAFHKNLYPYLTKCNYDLVVSEMISGTQRHDIILYRQDISLSAIVELKVNDLKTIEDDVNQIQEYLDKVDDKPYLFAEPPTCGVLAIYYISDNDRIADVDLKSKLNATEIKKHSNNFYLVIREDKSPVIIALLNGKE